MNRPRVLRPNELYRACDPREFSFESTAELAPLGKVFGQERALQALETAVGISTRGFNVFAASSDPGSCREQIQALLQRPAGALPAPPDLCYVFNVSEPRRPQALRLPAGTGARLQASVQALLDTLNNDIPAAFESDDYRHRSGRLKQALAQRQSSAIEEVQRQAAAADIDLVKTPAGFTWIPQRDGQPIDRMDFNRLPEPQRRRIEATIERLQEQLHAVLEQFPRWRREHEAALRALNEEVVLTATGERIGELRAAYAETPAALAHLETIRRDLGENVGALLEPLRAGGALDDLLARYYANLLVDHGDRQGAPIVFEDLPSVQRLLGRVEHTVQQGALVTDYRLIRSGSLHQANGGFLILEARKLLSLPFAWDALKRALRAGEVRIESLEQLLSPISTITLEPEPVALDLKVVLVGEPSLYYLLQALDPEFGHLFKLLADFADEIPRSSENQQLYARLLADLVRQHELRPLDRAATARAVEHASREAADAERLSVASTAAADLLIEADYLAAQAGHAVIDAELIQQAIDQRRYRAGRLHERQQEAVLRSIVRIATSGSAVGEANALAVAELGEQRFAHPVRVSATARLGRGQLIDIEREAKLGGDIHSKAVLMLTQFLAHRYAAEHELALAASIAFEQSYGPVEGDSASLAETCALLSAIAQVPLSQALAVTGSISQSGAVPAVGAVNEMVEGFFDVCRRRGLSGEHGVLIPQSNVQHLMLERELRAAVADGQFHVYALDSVDQALELLSGLGAGVRTHGHYPPDSFNGRVQQRLTTFAERAQRQRGGDGGLGHSADR